MKGHPFHRICFSTHHRVIIAQYTKITPSKINIDTTQKCGPRMGVTRIADVSLATYTLLSQLRYACIGCFLGNIYTMARMLHVRCPVGSIYLTTTFMFHVRCPVGNIYLTTTFMFHVRCPVGNINITTTFMLHVRYFFGNLSPNHTDTLSIKGRESSAPWIPRQTVGPKMDLETTLPFPLSLPPVLSHSPSQTRNWKFLFFVCLFCLFFKPRSINDKNVEASTSLWNVRFVLKH